MHLGRLKSKSVLIPEKMQKVPNLMASTQFLEKMDQLNGTRLQEFDKKFSSRNSRNDRVYRGKTSVSQSVSQQPSSFRDVVSNKKGSVLLMINGDATSGPVSNKHLKKAHRQINSLTESSKNVSSNQVHFNYKTVAEAS